jgi:HEPN superfamily Swt1-like protein
MSSFDDSLDAIRKLIALQRQIDDTQRALTGHSTESLERTRKMILEVTRSQRTLDEFTRSTQWTEISASRSWAERMLSQSEAALTLRRINETVKNIALGTNKAILPLRSTSEKYAMEAARSIALLDGNVSTVWQTSITERISRLNTHWAFEDHIGICVAGFARLARIHDISAGNSPFNVKNSEIIHEELGDPVPFDSEADPREREAARIDAGLNPEIVAFPQEAFPSVLVAAGFELRIKPIGPIRSEGGDQSGTLDPKHTELLGHVENHLRRLIELELQGLEGDRWQRRIHGNVRQKWKDRQSEDRERRGDAFPMLYYADFMELLDVISEGNNWNDAFHKFFVSKDDFAASMRRLGPIRNCIGHNRPLVRADQVTLFAEAYRILGAIGVQM